MVGINTDIVNTEIEHYGEDITLLGVSSATYSDWGDVSQTTSSSSIKAIYNVYGKGAEYQTEGEFTEGEVTFFIKSTTQNIDNDSEILRSNGERYKVRDHRDHSLFGTSYVREVLVNRV